MIILSTATAIYFIIAYAITRYAVIPVISRRVESRIYRELLVIAIAICTPIILIAVAWSLIAEWIKK